jgi:hypothetical protein
MKLSNKQKQELEAIRYFIPSWVTFDPITDKDIETFFAWSDRGIKLKINVMSMERTGLHALYYGKKYRDLQITSYLEDWGTYMNAWSFDEMPLNIVEYIAKRINKPAILEAYNA